MENLTFEQLNLPTSMQKAIDEMGFTEATSIQSQVIPVIKEGKDVIGRSQTGTGKTIAFAIPAVESILNSEKPSQLAQVLVLCPTRELTQQACSEIRKLTKYISNIKLAEVYGGDSMQKQINQLKTANLIIGTPGRIMDHMRRRTLKLKNLHMVVLDEADEMLSMGFKEDIEEILTDTPEEIQTVLFSATMPKPILDLTQKIQKNPVLIEINKQQITLDNIVQTYTDVPMGRKLDALVLLLKYYSPIRCVVFCNTKKMVDEIVEGLAKYGIDVQGLHGDMKQTQRTQVMDAFKHGKVRILVATDVAARGIDVKDIDYVVNYDIPQTNEYYVHRIGRTGRAGKAGNAITICSGRRQILNFQDVLRQTKSTAKQIEIPKASDISDKLISTQLENVKASLTQEVSPLAKDLLDKLLAEGYSLYDIAAYALQSNVTSALNGLKEIADIEAIKGKPDRNDSKKAYSKIMISVGRSSRIAPNHIVGAIAEKMDISGSLIGKIDIFEQYSTVEMPNDIAIETMEQMHGTKICGKPIQTQMVKIENNNRRSGSSENTRRSSKPASNKFGKRSNFSKANKSDSFKSKFKNK